MTTTKNGRNSSFEKYTKPELDFHTILLGALIIF